MITMGLLPHVFIKLQVNTLAEQPVLIFRFQVQQMGVLLQVAPPARTPHRCRKLTGLGWNGLQDVVTKVKITSAPFIPHSE